jgi:hypothetical protein
VPARPVIPVPELVVKSSRVLSVVMMQLLKEMPVGSKVIDGGVIAGLGAV